MMFKVKGAVINPSMGFILIEVLISGVILTTSIAATMYLFRMGFDYLERANKSNLLSSKLIQAASLIKNLDLEQKSGSELLGAQVSLKWEARLLGRARPIKKGGEFSVQSLYEISLYRVNIILSVKDIERAYTVNAFRYKPLFTPGEFGF
jgi:hypothetical protein